MESVRGTVTRLLFRKESNNYTVLTVSHEGEEITCVGSMPGVEEGETLEMQGQFVTHPLYGLQFKVTSYELTVPDDAEGAEMYLSSGAIKGIGPTLAARIVKAFGGDTIRIMEEEPERLAEIKGISSRMAESIGQQMADRKDLRDAMIFLSRFEISSSLAVKIYDTYGEELYVIMRENPYRLAEDIRGVGFKRADEIAARAGIGADSEFRIACGILHLLGAAGGEGHMYLPEPVLLEKAADLLGLPEAELIGRIESMAMNKRVILRRKDDTRLVYSAASYYAELACARMLSDLNITFPADKELLSEQNELIPRSLRRLEEAMGMELDDLQKQALRESAVHGVMILSGGPGTGKTTVINAMIRYYEGKGCNILLAAPTGRAAKRMTEATGFEAKTIHRMLEFNGGADSEEEIILRFGRDKENPLEADVIIIDEMSMVDIYLFKSLLEAIECGTRLILVGDVDQLPSVGPGEVLRDLIQSEAFCTVMLKKIFRQSEESDIVVNAHRINEGQMPVFRKGSSDFFFLKRDNVGLIYKHLVELVRDKLPSYVNGTFMDVQVLTPMRKGMLGVEKLNEILQKYLNPEVDDKEEVSLSGGGLFREGDKVMQIRNNYQLEWEITSRHGIVIDKGQGIFNGDVGIVKEISHFASVMIVEFDEHRQVSYSFSQLDELELAYAVTIHKSQGSEYPAVVIPLLSGPSQLFSRSLLYTAVTRAKSCLLIMGEEETLENMVNNQVSRSRYTSLEERIRELQTE